MAIETYFRHAFYGLVTAIATVAGSSASAGELGDVDAAIVFAVDASSSIDATQAYEQRRGHVSALRSREVLEAITGGPVGCIAISYVEWAGVGKLRVVLPWTKLCDGQDASRAASRILAETDFASEHNGGRTSLSYAIEASSLMLDNFPGTAARKLIDVSANGTNNDGPPVVMSRERVLAKGHVINAIVLMNEEPGVTSDLPGYFRQNVIGGPGSFIVTPGGPVDYAHALRRKFVVEISGSEPFTNAGKEVVTR
jgi:hypothetical protein